MKIANCRFSNTPTACGGVVYWKSGASIIARWALKARGDAKETGVDEMLGWRGERAANAAEQVM